MDSKCSSCATLRSQVEELKENAKKAWEECHATSSELSKASQDRDRWRECAVYLDYRGADYCVAIHKELDGLQADNAEHREQMSRLLKNWKSRATRAEADYARTSAELQVAQSKLLEAEVRVEKLERVRVAVRDATDGSIDLTRCTVCEARMRGVDIKHEAYCIVGKVVASLAECGEVA